MMRISTTVGVPFVMGFETYVPWVYDDKVPAQRIGNRLVYREWKRGDPIVGTLTIGFGHTDSAKYNLGFDLCNVPPGFRLSEEQAKYILDVDLDECEQYVNQMVKVPLTQGQFDALVSFTFNCGPGALGKLVARLNRGDYAATRKAFDLYVISGGERMRGLQRRRDGEQDLWDSNVPTPQSEPVDHPAEVDLVDAGPATIWHSAEANVQLGVGGGAGSMVVNSVTNAAEKVADKGTSWDTLVLDVALQVLASPQFWFGVVILTAAAFTWLRRRERLNTGGL